MANLAFHHVAREYAKFRPDYPDAVLDHLHAMTSPPDGRWALDLGCGTGRLARPLASAGWNVIAADADESMLRSMPRNESAQPNAVRCVAEAIGVSDGAVSLVTCAQALHWFNPRYALPQIARVLKNPGGVAVFLLTDRCPTSPFVAQFDEFIRQWAPGFRREYAIQDWCAKLQSTGEFSRLTDTTVNWTWRPKVEQFIGYAGTLTYLRNTVRRDDWPQLVESLTQLANERFPTGHCEIPMITRFIAARRTSGGA